MTESPTIKLPTPDQLIASSVKYLLEGQDEEAASVLLTCQVEQYASVEGDWGGLSVNIGFRGPRVAYDLLKEWSSADYDSVARRVRAALEAVILTCPRYVVHLF
jgi:hypothetical protein